MTNTTSPAASSSSTTGPSPRSIAIPATFAERSRLTIDLIAAVSWVKLNRSATVPSPPTTQATWTSDAQSIPATTPSATAAPISSVHKAGRRQALVLAAHCKALEARGPIASHSARPPGPAALLLALQGRASAAVARRLPALHQHPHERQHHQEWINEHRSITAPLRSAGWVLDN